MAKRRAVPKRKKARAAAAAVPDFSLEDILAEYRAAPGTEETEPVFAPQESPPEEEAHLPVTEEPAEDEIPAESGEHIEGYVDDNGQYASAQPQELPEEAWDDDEYIPKNIRVKPGKRSKGGLLHRLQGRIVAMLAVSAFKNEQRRSEKEAIPEDPATEMPPLDAARFYAGQIPSLRGRCKLAFAVTMLPLWVALGHGAGFPLPGALATDLRMASLLSLTALLSVMLIGLDVITSGILSLFRGRPGAETMIALAALASVADCWVAVLSEKSVGALPPALLPCVSIAMALLGSWQNCRAYRAGFISLARAENPFAVTNEQLLKRKEAFLIRSRQSMSGFIRRSEEPDGCETLSTVLTPFAMVASLVLSALVAVTHKSFMVFPHVFAILTAVSAAWCALGAIPLLFAATAEHFRRSGGAIAGWSGARDMGEASHLILTDSDIFPEGSVALSAVRLVKGELTDKVVSYTGSMMAAAGSELAALFTDLMQRSGSTMVPVDEFVVGEGGATAFINGEKVSVGCAGYMHLCGVKIPPTMVSGDAIYTAFLDRLVGAFVVDYTPVPSVREALVQLQRSRRKPIFAARDFNIDPLLIKEKFKCPTEGFEFPPVPERYEISDLPASGKSPVGAMLSGGGLGKLADMFTRGRQLYRSGLVCQVLTAGCTLLGLALGFLWSWEGSWAMVSSWRLFLFMLLWTLPVLLMLLNTRE
ncbi:MAG: hypothetical protein IJE26_02270 [Oscillospiraceae bacterium]|nr:hypothetical protein [Oscillospiraceae bacterium]